jgi:hypothetical protein
MALLAAMVAGCATRPEMYAESRSYYRGDHRTDAYSRGYDRDDYAYHEYHSMDHRSGEGDPFREHGH